MVEFLQAYGGWILIGVLFFLMMRMRGGGMGCGMGHGGHEGHQDSRRASGQDEPEAQPKTQEAAGAEERTPVSSGRHRGC